MRFTWLSALVLSLAMLAPCAQASVIQARSEIPATVIMDGTPMGPAPLNISQVAPGDHELAFRSMETGAIRAYRVSMPFDATISTTVLADFTNTGPVVVEAMPIVAAPPVIVAHPVVYGCPIVRPAPVIVIERSHHRRRRYHY